MSKERPSVHEIAMHLLAAGRARPDSVWNEVRDVYCDAQALYEEGTRWEAKQHENDKPSLPVGLPERDRGILNAVRAGQYKFEEAQPTTKPLEMSDFEENELKNFMYRDSNDNIFWLEEYVYNGKWAWRAEGEFVGILGKPINHTPEGALCSLNVALDGVYDVLGLAYIDDPET